MFAKPWKDRTIRKMIALLCAVIMVFCCAACGSATDPSQRKEKPGTADPTKAPTEKPADPTEAPEDPTATPTTPPADPTGAPVSGGSTELTGGSSGSPAETKEPDDVMREAYETFAYRMLKAIPGGETRMISPFSIYTALAMLDNGAEANTLAQIDSLLGLTETERNAYMAAWIRRLTESQEGAVFTNADSIWVKSALEKAVPKAFLDTCAQYYKAAVFSAAMDAGTVNDVNGWVKKNTMGMIDKIVDELSPATAMILINAIALDAKWWDPFLTDAIRTDYTFTKEDGTTAKVDMMFGEADYGYLENELCSGFTKSYKGGEFKYVALLPKEGVTIAQLVDSLQPGVVKSLWENEKRGEVHIGLPKYEEEYSLLLNDVLKELGMTEAFDEYTAQFGRLVDPSVTSVYVSKVLHKTFISVDNEGTKAAAVTAIVMDEATAIGPENIYRVVLDRPFVYMIVDSEGMPIFLGTYEG